MRWWLLVLAACGDSASPAEDRTIAMLEGGHEERLVTGTDQPDWPTWAKVVDGTLTLDPPCSVVTGTSGPPAVFVLDQADGGQAITVQVSPSLEGTCLPRVLACVNATDGRLDETDPCWQDSTTHEPDDRKLQTGFCTPSNQCNDAVSLADKFIHLRLDQRGDAQALAARITTDAPIVFDGGGDPLNFGEQIVGQLFNAGALGKFKVAYLIAVDHSLQDEVAQGSFDLLWGASSAEVGLEAVNCTANGSCVFARPTRAVPDGHLCVATDQQTTIGFRLWIDPMMPSMPSFDTLHLDGASAGATQKASLRSPDGIPSNTAGVIEIPLSGRSGPFDILADVGNPAGQLFQFRLWACNSNSPPQCADLPAVDQTTGPRPDATLEIEIDVAGLTACQ